MDKKVTLIFRNEVIEITAHALSRLGSRFMGVEGTTLRKPLKTLEKLLKKATEENLPSQERTIRLLKNNLTPAEYYRSGIWRLVIIREGLNMPLLVTVEIAEPQRQFKKIKIPRR